MTKTLKNLEWLGYPEGDLDSIVFVYFYKKWKVIPIDIVRQYILYDDKVSIVHHQNSFLVVDGKIKEKENKFINKSGLELDLLKATIDNQSIRVYESYLCSLNNSLKYFSDCIYLNTTNIEYTKENYLCTSSDKLNHGIIFSSKDIDETGKSKKKTSLLIGDLEKTLKWLKKFSSAVSEKNSIIIPTNKDEWIKKYPKTTIIDLNKH